MLPERSAKPTSTESAEQIRVEVDLERWDDPMWIVLFPLDENLLDLRPKSRTFFSQREIDRFVIVDPEHQDCAKRVEIHHEVQRPVDVVDGFPLCPENERMAVGNSNI